MKYACSIVIRAFNEEGYIGHLINGIHQQSEKDIQIVLVDSGSNDRTVDIAADLGAEIVNIQPNDFTFGRSLNLGISKANAELVVIASAHVYPVYPDWIQKMLGPFSNPEIALVYGRQRGAQTSKFSEQQIFNHWYGETSHTSQNHPFCNNANAAIRKSLWQQHPYDENLPGLEDLEWAKWALEKKYKIVYLADAEIIHVHHESWHGILNRYLREGMAFKQIYPQEKFSYLEFIHLFLKNSFSDMVEANKQRVLFREFWKILKFRWLQFHGTYLGFKQSGPLNWQLKQSFYYPRNSSKNHPGKNRVDIEPIDYSGVSR